MKSLHLWGVGSLPLVSQVHFPTSSGACRSRIVSERLSRTVNVQEIRQVIWSFIILLFPYDGSCADQVALSPNLSGACKSGTVSQHLFGFAILRRTDRLAFLDTSELRALVFLGLGHQLQFLESSGKCWSWIEYSNQCLACNFSSFLLRLSQDNGRQEQRSMMP